MTFILLLSIAFVLAGLLGFTAWKSRDIARRFPNIGSLTDIGGMKLNSLLVPAGTAADLPPLLFIHGASGNLRDPYVAFAPHLNGRATLLFIDRPGHGYSERGGSEMARPDGQAAALAKLLTAHGIDKAIVIGHSFGGSIAAALAVNHPERVAGLLFLSAATHPWPGGIDWYYRLAARPVLGWLFTRLISLPAGLMRLDSGSNFVFAPNRRPDDYLDSTAPALVLRPQSFRNNARDVAGLKPYVEAHAQHYRSITAPTVIITGDSDTVVLEEIHSGGLARDIPHSQLVWVKGLGHKPDYVVTDLCIAAIEVLAGHDRDLQALARQCEDRLSIAQDR